MGRESGRTGEPGPRQPLRVSPPSKLPRINGKIRDEFRTAFGMSGANLPPIQGVAVLIAGYIGGEAGVMRISDCAMPDRTHDDQPQFLGPFATRPAWPGQPFSDSVGSYPPPIPLFSLVFWKQFPTQSWASGCRSASGVSFRTDHRRNFDDDPGFAKLGMT